MSIEVNSRGSKFNKIFVYLPNKIEPFFKKPVSIPEIRKFKFLKN